jgi:ribosomal protein S26
LDVVVFRFLQRAVDQPSCNASLPEKKAVCVTQSEAELESIRIQETQNSESTLVAYAQIPTHMTTIRQKTSSALIPSKLKFSQTLPN